MDIPKDMKAYIEDAMLEVIKEAGFKPNSPNALLDFIAENKKAILDRASNNMWNLLHKIADSNIKNKVVGVLSAKVWQEINSRDINRKIKNHLTELLSV